MTILVTGLDHPIAPALIARARAQGLQVKALAAPGDFDRRSGAELIAGSLQDAAALDAALRDVEIVFHTALLAQGTPEALHRTNVDGTRRLLEACAGDIRRLVMISSPAVYAPHPFEDSWPILADEPRAAHGTGSLSAYGQSMIDAEDLVMLAGRLYALDYVLLRTTTMWGPSLYPRAVLNALMRNPDNAGVMHQAMGPIQWIHPDDAARAALLAARAEAARGQTYIVAGSASVTVFDLLETLWDITRADEANPFREDANAQRPAHPKLDPAKIARILGFTAEIPLRQSLEETLELTEPAAELDVAAG